MTCQNKELRQFRILERNASMVSILLSVSDHHTSTQVPPLYTDGVMPIHSALHPECTVHDLRLFVDLHPDGLHAKDSHGNLPLHLALQERCNTKVIEYLTRECPWAVRVKNEDGNLPLHLALLHKASIDTIELLLHQFLQGAEVEGKHGLPLTIATFNGLDLPVVQLLAQVNPNALTTACLDGNLPLHLSVTSNNVEVVDWLASIKTCTLEVCNKQGHYPLHTAITRECSFEMIQLLLDHFPQACQFADKNGNLPMHLALQYNMSKEVIQMLVDAYPTACMIESYALEYPLQVAYQNRASMDVIKLLSLHSPSKIVCSVVSASLDLKALVSKSKKPLTVIQMLALIGLLKKLQQPKIATSFDIVSA
jgi:ankyrin repeat protein